MDLAQITGRLSRLEGWELEGDTIRKVYTFPDFPSAMAFANRVAGIAEQAGHHPDILVQYCKVTLALTTHDAGGLTKKDFDLAAQIDAL
ncbi:MAG TPA: 4a-hydroxytetrahydrobiopterin dehydratase [Candidatus Nanoarchaeia archaeon]|nr:4a-hydroxytetrahydrobiopterin dehydratase [Candidatus Nanoarchaeia archaeon]